MKCVLLMEGKYGNTRSYKCIQFSASYQEVNYIYFIQIIKTLTNNDLRMKKFTPFWFGL